MRIRDYARADRAYERQLRHHQADVDIRAARAGEGENMAEGLPARGRSWRGAGARGRTWSLVYRIIEAQLRVPNRRRQDLVGDIQPHSAARSM